VATAAGSVTVPLDVTDMADGTVWLPANSPGSAVRSDLGAGHGSRVTLRRAE
jgi:NADH-quinone oxidoreductase subunit G